MSLINFNIVPETLENFLILCQCLDEQDGVQQFVADKNVFFLYNNQLESTESMENWQSMTKVL